MKKCKRCECEKELTQFSSQIINGREYFNTNCKPCVALIARERRKQNPERHAEIVSAWREKNRQKLRDQNKARRLANPEKYREERKKNYYSRQQVEIEKMREYKQANKERLRAHQHNKYWADQPAARAKQKKYRDANPGLYQAMLVRRRERYARATPSWADQELIRDIYILSAIYTRETGIPHEVDHIVPLQGRLVCGLHVEHNLRVVTRTENRVKNNSFEVC